MSARPSTPGVAQHRFPGFDVLDDVKHWDQVTAGVVLSRLSFPPDVRFFTPAEFAVAEALLDQLLDQHDDPKVPVAQLIDARLTEMQTDGWRYEDMPHDDQAWRDTLAHLDTDAGERCDAGFARCTRSDQSMLVQAVQDLGSQSWHGLNAAHVWSLWTRYACTAFYSHPWAWNEIGFAGPAYPRGYKNLGIDTLEKGEVRDARPSQDPAKRAGS
ncbi:MAG: gluconate 2-dehydrogenase subunit 3 family protein [Nakamurella sp.]